MNVRRLSVLSATAVLIGALIAQPGRAALPDPTPLPQLSLEEVQSLFHVHAPPAGVGMLVFADFPLENPLKIDGLSLTALTLDVTGSGVVTRNAVASSAAESDEKVEECTDPAFGTVGKKWDSSDLPVKYALNRSSVPEYMSPWLATRSLREGHQVWGESNSKCNESDPIDFSFQYVGDANAHIKYDGTNVTDFGRLGKALGVSYVWYTSTRIREVDLRINKEYMWTNIARKSAKRYIVKNVVVHETGHHLGLDDLSSPHESLTMFGVISKGELRKTTLGRGDVKGAEVLSP